MTISTINFHLIKACNFKCKFCYATFDDIPKKSLSKSETLELLKQLWESQKFKKINFAGGEPTLIPYINELITHAKNLGFTTSIVTNASRIDAQWVKDISTHLDILAVSIDSLEESTNQAIGRNEKSITISNQKLIEIANACHSFGVSLKVNTVVSQFNKNEVLTDFINKLKPFRWKILQVTKIENQNDAEFDKVKIKDEDFSNFCASNIKGLLLKNIIVVKESDSLIKGSYLMIDPLGRFYDSSQGKYIYSKRILEVGVEKALAQVSPDYDKFMRRGGDYTV